MTKLTYQLGHSHFNTKGRRCQTINRSRISTHCVFFMNDRTQRHLSIPKTRVDLLEILKVWNFNSTKKRQRKRKISVKPVAIHSWQSQDKPFWRREEEWESRNKALSSLPLSDNNILQEEKTESTWSLQCQVCMCCEERCEEKSQKSQRKHESVPWWLVDSHSFERDCWVTPLIDGTRWLAFLHRATTCGVRTTAWLKRKG